VLTGEGLDKPVGRDRFYYLSLPILELAGVKSLPFLPILVGLEIDLDFHATHPQKGSAVIMDAIARQRQDATIVLFAAVAA
jgi:hypothetical protein